MILIVLGAITLYIIAQFLLGLLDPILGMFGHAFGLFETMLSPLTGALSGVFGALGSVPSIGYEAISEHNVGVFEEFVEDINSRCAEEDAQEPPLQWAEMPGNSYDWEEDDGLEGIDVQDGNKLVAYGGRNLLHTVTGQQDEHVREAVDCETVEICGNAACADDSGGIIDGIADWTLGQNGRINPIDDFAYVRSADGFIGVGPGELAGEEVNSVGARPVAVMAYSPENPEVGRAVTFEGATIPDYTYHWDIGNDGTNEYEDTMTAEHTFDEPGTYEVRLTVVDEDGQEGWTVEEIEVTEQQDTDPGDVDVEIHEANFDDVEGQQLWYEVMIENQADEERYMCLQFYGEDGGDQTYIGYDPIGMRESDLRIGTHDGGQPVKNWAGDTADVTSFGTMPDYDAAEEPLYQYFEDYLRVDLIEVDQGDIDGLVACNGERLLTVEERENGME